MTPSNGPAARPGAGRPETLGYGVFLLALGAVPLVIVHAVNYLHVSALPVITPAAEDAQHRSLQALLVIAGYLVAAGLTFAGRKWARVVASVLAGFAVFGSVVSIGDTLNYATLYGVGDSAYAFAAGSALALSTIGLVLLYQESVNNHLAESTATRRRARNAASNARRSRTGGPVYVTAGSRGQR